MEQSSCHIKFGIIPLEEKKYGCKMKMKVYSSIESRLKKKIDWYLFIAYLYVCYSAVGLTGFLISSVTLLSNQ